MVNALELRIVEMKLEMKIKNYVDYVARRTRSCRNVTEWLNPRARG